LNAPVLGPTNRPIINRLSGLELYYAVFLFIEIAIMAIINDATPTTIPSVSLITQYFSGKYEHIHSDEVTVNMTIANTVIKFILILKCFMIYCQISLEITLY